MPKRKSVRPVAAEHDGAEIAARSFCYALAEKTTRPGNWRQVSTIADRLGVSFDEAMTIAEDCAQREWVDHARHSVRLLEKGRAVAEEVRALIGGKPFRSR